MPRAALWVLINIQTIKMNHVFPPDKGRKTNLHGYMYSHSSNSFSTRSISCYLHHLWFAISLVVTIIIWDLQLQNIATSVKVYVCNCKSVFILQMHTLPEEVHFCSYLSRRTFCSNEINFATEQNSFFFFCADPSLIPVYSPVIIVFKMCTFHWNEWWLKKNELKSITYTLPTLAALSTALNMSSALCTLLHAVPYILFLRNVQILT